MTHSRREKIEAMLADDPSDEFLRYSLAIELAREDRHDESLVLLQALMGESPPYLAAFFQAARQLVDQRNLPAAREALRQGIEVARAQGDHHAAGEMSEFLVSLGRESD